MVLIFSRTYFSNLLCAHTGTAWLGLRSGDPISPANVLEALENQGPLEAFCIEPLPRDYGWTLVCIVTFAYVDDCKDAIRVHYVSCCFCSSLSRCD